MTNLRIQNLKLENCEEAIFRQYYDWGRERKSKDQWMERDWDDADTKCRKTTALRGYALYDGCQLPLDDHMTAVEIWVTVGFRSRIQEFDVIRFLARADKALPLLSVIPGYICLENATDEHLEAVSQLVSVFVEAHQINLAKATKVLHKKRPFLVPIFDSVVFDFLWKNFPHIVSQSTSTKNLIELFRSILLTHIEPIERIQSNLAQGGFDLSNVRVLDWIIWIGWQHRVRDGFGRPIKEIWGVDTLAEARAKSRESWNAVYPSSTGWVMEVPI